ncbi:MAG: hypothetical protein JXQ29_17745 [Planctomycetes bacterium]|nr:hypothetical protein [Planctomycetota bacterium]
MAVRVSPHPNDGPLSAQAATVTVCVSAPGWTTLAVVIRTPDGTLVPIAHDLLSDGSTTLHLPLPPGGVPSGSRLILKLVEPSGQKTVLHYKLL